MKNFKIIFTFLFAICCLLSNITYTQDYRLGLGKVSLRFDYDSNYIRLEGNGGTPPKIAREFNAQLFDFNTSQFTWNTSTGLNLNAGLLNNADSLTTAKLKLVKDSTAGETTWRKEYNIYRPYYNIYDSTLIKIQYKNSRWNSTAEWFLVNTIDEPVNSTDGYVLTDAMTPILEWTVPHSGTWRLDADFDYEYQIDSIINWGTSDSIYVVLDYEEPPSKAHWIRKVYSPYNTKFGESGTGHITLIIPKDITGGWLYAYATQNALFDVAKPVEKRIYNIRFILTLEN